MISLFSPAKLNLFLHVVRRRPDGYHDLASLFQAIDFGDTLTLSLADKDKLTIVGPSSSGISCDPSNLILKAASLFRQKTGLHFGVDVLLDKHVPIQAGLGGGSSNAATTLWGLNVLCGSPASLDDLILWSGEIGSDITFFLSQGTAYCTGRGEIIRPMPKLPSHLFSSSFYVVKPNWGLSTPAVFQQLKSDEIIQKDPETILQNYYLGKPDYHNDLEAAAIRAEPELATLKNLLKQGGFETVVMTGSGTSLFCLGNGTIPSWPQLLSKKVSFLRRPEDEWYTYPN